MAELKLKTPSVLAFEAKLIPSDALMFAGNWGEESWDPIKVGEKAVRGTISNRLKAAMANDPVKLDAEVSKANLQTVDIAALDH
ncbi:type I-F CRISPR-associated protein Cas7f/Csy3, partial [Alteromonas sp. BZK5]